MNSLKFLTKWNIFLLVILGAAVTIIYVNNVVRVNLLLSENRTLEYQCTSLLTTNNRLRNELLHLQSTERVLPIARERLGLVHPSSAPIIIEGSN